MTWRVARSLDTLLAELNAAAPGRSKVSDGSIGDAAHASRSSDHNPWVTLAGVGIVRARDFTHDPGGGLDCNDLADYLVRLIGVHPALTSGAYVIWNRRILSFDRRAEGWRTYTGSNPHDHHLHLSVALSVSGYDSTAPWGWPPLEDDMFSDEDRKKLDTLTGRIGKLADALAEQGKTLDRIRSGSFRRDKKLIELARATSDDVDTLLAKADE